MCPLSCCPRESNSQHERSAQSSRISGRHEFGIERKGREFRQEKSGACVIIGISELCLISSPFLARSRTGGQLNQDPDYDVHFDTSVLV